MEQQQNTPQTQPSVSPTASPKQYKMLATGVIIGILLCVLVACIVLLRNSSYIKFGSPSVSPTIAPEVIIQSTQAPINPISDYKTYVNFAYKYSIKYPPAWKVEAIASFSAEGEKDSKDVSHMRIYNSTSTKKEDESIVFSVEKTTYISLDDYLVDIETISKTSDRYPRIIKKNNTKLGGDEAIYYETELSGVKILYVLTLRNGYLYEISIQNPKIEETVKIFNNVASAFTFLDKAIRPKEWAWKKYSENWFSIEYPAFWIVYQADEIECVYFIGGGDTLKVCEPRNGIPEVIPYSQEVKDNPTISEFELGKYKGKRGKQKTLIGEQEVVYIDSKTGKSVYFAYDRLDSWIFEHLLSTLTFSGEEKYGGVFEISFQLCMKGSGRIMGATGSVLYEITGKTSSNCLFEHGGGIKGDDWDGSINMTCRIPLSIGSVLFKRTAKGADFSPIKNQCKQK